MFGINRLHDHFRLLKDPLTKTKSKNKEMYIRFNIIESAEFNSDGEKWTGLRGVREQP